MLESVKITKQVYLPISFEQLESYLNTCCNYSYIRRKTTDNINDTLEYLIEDVKPIFLDFLSRMTEDTILGEKKLFNSFFIGEVLKIYPFMVEKFLMDKLTTSLFE